MEMAVCKYCGQVSATEIPEKQAKNISERYCRSCGSRFEGLLDVCDLCRAREKELNRLRRDKSAKKPKAARHYRPAADIGLVQLVRIIDRYNKRHGTHLSYGKFMQLVYDKKIDLRREAGR